MVKGWCAGLGHVSFYESASIQIGFRSAAASARARRPLPGILSAGAGKVSSNLLFLSAGPRTSESRPPVDSVLDSARPPCLGPSGFHASRRLTLGTLTTHHRPRTLLPWPMLVYW